MPVRPSPLQNRVDPFGDIVATPSRGAMMGNRGGCFHDHNRSLTRRRWSNRHWITCVLDFKERRRTVMAPGRYTELFFLDEVTALAAGHRPCAECRRQDFNRYATLWNKFRDTPGRAYVNEMDPVLHAQRRASGQKLENRIVRTKNEPDGVFVALDGLPHLVWQGRVYLWSFDGYVDKGSVSELAEGLLLTPVASRDILAAGYSPCVHPSVETQP